MQIDDEQFPANGPGRGRALAVRVLAVLALVSYSFLFLLVAAEAAGLTSANPQGDPNDPAPSAAAREGAAALGEAVHLVGALAIVALGATASVALIARPGRTGSGYQLLACAGGFLAATPIVGNPDNVGGQAGMVDPAFVILATPALIAAVVVAPWRAGLGRLSVPLLVLGAIAAVGLIPYGVDQALMQRNTYPPTADPHHQAHWVTMAVMAFSIVGVVLTAAIGGGGWRLAALVAAAGVLAVGVASIADGDAASSFGLLGGAVAVLWSVGVFGVVLTARTVGPRR